MRFFLHLRQKTSQILKSFNKYNQKKALFSLEKSTFSIDFV